MVMTTAKMTLPSVSSAKAVSPPFEPFCPFFSALFERPEPSKEGGRGENRRSGNVSKI